MNLTNPDASAKTIKTNHRANQTMNSLRMSYHIKPADNMTAIAVQVYTWVVKRSARRRGAGLALGTGGAVSAALFSRAISPLNLAVAVGCAAVTGACVAPG